MRALRFSEVRCLPEAVPEEGAELRHEPLFLVTASSRRQNPSLGA